MLDHVNQAPENQAQAPANALHTEAHNMTHRPTASVVVQKGDTLGEMAQHHLGKGANVHDVYNYVNKIGHANKLKDVNHIEAGQTLHFPPIHGHHKPEHKADHKADHKKETQPEHRPEHKPGYKPEQKALSTPDTKPAHETSPKIDPSTLHRRPHTGQDTTAPAASAASRPVDKAGPSDAALPKAQPEVQPTSQADAQPKAPVEQTKAAEAAPKDQSVGTAGGTAPKPETAAPVKAGDKLDVSSPTDTAQPKATADAPKPSDAQAQPVKAPDAPVVSAPIASFVDGAKNEVVNNTTTVLGTGVAAAAIGAAMRYAPSSVRWGAVALGTGYLGYQAWSQGGNVLKAIDVASDPGYYSNKEIAQSNATFKSLGGTAVDAAAAGVGAGVTTGFARRMISSGYSRALSSLGMAPAEAAPTAAGEAVMTRSAEAAAPVRVPEQTPTPAPAPDVAPATPVADADNWARLHQPDKVKAQMITDADPWARLHAPQKPAPEKP